jgi:uncharacterized protein (TIGR02145 family)
MSYFQRTQITSPVAGLTVWCSNCGLSGELQVFNGSTWTNVIGGQASLVLPGAPTNPVATAGNAQASIAFTTPTSDGGNTITSYTVTSSPGNYTATGANSPLVVTGLSNLTSYTFTVVATNAAGNSIPSVASTAVIPGTVIGAGGRIWMDRNLGATRVATSSTDAEAYGDLYQWGRGTDGHQLRNSATTNTPSSTDQPGNSNFILVNNPTNDWRSPQNPNLWQGVNGVNNPCPNGYRLPINSEWEAERLSWSSNNSVGAFASPLKLTLAGFRDFLNGRLIGMSDSGYYWSSTFNSPQTSSISISLVNAAISPFDHPSFGSSVRCIKD